VYWACRGSWEGGTAVYNNHDDVNDDNDNNNNNNNNNKRVSGARQINENV